MLAKRRYSGPPLDRRWQYITERPELDDRDDDEDEEDDVDVETIYVTDPEPPGEERVENVPVPKPSSIWNDDGPSESEQSTLSDWGRP